MALITTPPPRSARRPTRPAPAPAGSNRPAASPPPRRRIARNFAAMTAAELVCRAATFLVTLALARRLGSDVCGRLEFAFGVVVWLTMLVRDGLEVIAAREIARHPRLIRPLVGLILAVKGTLAAGLYAGLVGAGALSLSTGTEKATLALYGLLLATTALGVDFVFRGTERMGLLAASLVLRAAVYAFGVTAWVVRPERILWVPASLVVGELCGIAAVWAFYLRRYGPPRPSLGGRALGVLIRRGRSVYLIQIAQTVVVSVDLLVVNLVFPYRDIGLYSLPHRMATVILTFGLILQQVIFPALARSWRDRPDAARLALDASVRVLMIGLVPLAVGATVLAGPLVEFLHLPAGYRGAGRLLALGIWRAPLLSLAYLYQTALIALNRESAGAGLLVGGAIGAGPVVASLGWAFGLPGAAAGVIVIGLALVAAGYGRLALEGRQPAWHHHLGLPLLASAAMVPACLALRHTHVLVAVVGGAAVYLLALAALGGLRRRDIEALLGKA